MHPHAVYMKHACHQQTIVLFPFLLINTSENKLLLSSVLTVVYSWQRCFPFSFLLKVNDTGGKAPQCSLQKPDAVKLDLPILSTPKSEKPMVRPSLIFILIWLQK